MSAQTLTPATDIVDAINAGRYSAVDLERIFRAAKQAHGDQRAASLRQYGPEVRLKSSSTISPSYLSGCRGTLGPKKGTKWVFYPEAGSRAAQRAPEWRITFDAFDAASQLIIEGQNEMLAEGRIS